MAGSVMRPNAVVRGDLSVRGFVLPGVWRGLGVKGGAPGVVVEVCVRAGEEPVPVAVRIGSEEPRVGEAACE